MTKHEHDFMYEKWARQIIFRIQNFNTRANLYEIFFHPESTKNDNAAIATIKKIETQTDSIKSINTERVRRKGIENLLNCALMFFFPY